MKQVERLALWESKGNHGSLTIQRQRTLAIRYFPVKMRNSPEFADHLRRLQGLVVKAEPQLYQVIYTQHLDMPTSEEPLPALPNPEVAPSLALPTLS